MEEGHRPISAPPEPGKQGLRSLIKSFVKRPFRSKKKTRSSGVPTTSTARPMSTMSLPESLHSTKPSDLSYRGSQSQIFNVASGSSHLSDPTPKWEEDTQATPQILPQTPMTDHNSGSATRPIASEPKTPEWRENGKEGLAVASRFVQTLLKKAPDCVDGNPVKMALSIVKMVIEIKDEIGDNDDKLQQQLKHTEEVRRVVDRAITLGVPKAVEEKLQTFEEAIKKEVDAFNTLLQKWTITKILDYEQQKAEIQEICKQLNDAIQRFQLDMIVSIQVTSGKMHDDIKKAQLHDRLSPSAKADHNTDFKHQFIKREECTPETRVDILQEITDWAMDSDGARIFWLTGQAGAGKTTIGYTLAKRFEENPRSQTTLGANFLCSRQFAETRERMRIIPTLAYQLARKYPSFADALHVADKFDSVDRAIPVQMRDLFIQPWLQSGLTLEQAPPFLIIIDALDELEEDGGSVFLSELLKVIGDLRRLKFLVISRPEPDIVAICDKFGSKYIRRLQDVPTDTVKHDIDRYLRQELPGLADSDEMVEVRRRADTLFIYAATVVKYLTRGRKITIHEQKEKLRRLLSSSHDETSAKQATFLLDELYRHIIYDAFGEYEGAFLKDRLLVLYTILCTVERTPPSVVSTLNGHGNPDIVTAVFESLYAVLYSQDDQIFWYHASFPDFMFDPKRSCFTMQGQTFDITCSRALHHLFLSRTCFRVMRDGLRFNMARLPSSYSLDRQVERSRQDLRNGLQPALIYACRYWADHMQASLDHQVGCTTEAFLKEMRDHREGLRSFLDNHWLFWLEVMNWFRAMRYCQKMLETVLVFYNEVKNLRDDETASLQLQDAIDFVSHFSNSPASASTPHLYLSALMSWGHDSPLMQRWRNKFDMTFTNSLRHDLLNCILLVIPNALTTMRIVHVSGEVNLLASALHNETFRVWDSRTGFKHDFSFGPSIDNTLTFSPSGSHMAIGLVDRSFVHWVLAASGNIAFEYGGNSNTHPVKSVALSPESRLLASGSSDGTILLWEIYSKKESMLRDVQDDDPINSLFFSPDSMRIVSGHSQGKVIVTDISTKQVLMELKGHTNSVDAVAFSPDGRLIVSGSGDGTIKLWNAYRPRIKGKGKRRRGQHVMDLAGHTAGIWSIAFSDDNQQVHSSSVDSAVKIWDVSTGQLVDEFIAEMNPVDVFPGHDSEAEHIVCLPRKHLRVKCGLCVNINRRIVDSMPGTNWASCYKG